ncbi:fumarylacetoacetase [Amycolatopsis sp. PS_44_ISF1]|uniref:fumarylacetoacetase n=1 Tax=Amycolatopsis sp. PS_44_ISF1 TaxID=2974917 RepID=UPI0028E025C1|nr:fumarylacetoacetase [Amycolatopsis sp. PS_44_ISF1]MDT8914891.1 fumarylacetoacetase [Amycolatopsis sp. PS_44_ISF1]
MTWLDLAEDSPFGLDNLPYGVFSRGGEPARRVGVAVGEHVLDLPAAAEEAAAPFAGLLGSGVLNPLLAAGPATWREVRAQVREWLTEPRYADQIGAHLVPLAEITNHLPFEVADYVDFYSSEQHAINAGRILGGEDARLPRNWKSVPIGYHGRAGTVVVSGTPVVRPSGQRWWDRAAGPSFGPSERLDVEAEVGFVVGTGSAMGTPVPVGDFAEHVFGVCLVNDWSARDLQIWESQPLGPFLGKSFATSVSPWIVPLDALEHARVPQPPQDPEPFAYLRGAEPWGLDLALEVRLNGHLVASPPFATQYWTAAQQLAHLTVNGASLRTGDLYASGTVTGPERHQRGSLLELSWGGREPFELAGGETRTFLEDGDEVVISASAPGSGGRRIGFGDVRGRVVPH